jgi:deoxyribonuclease V
MSVRPPAANEPAADGLDARWPTDDDALRLVQQRLAAHADRARDEEPLALPTGPLLGGCFVAFARGEAGPGHPGDRAWTAAVTWQPTGRVRDEGEALRGRSHADGPRVARDTVEQVVVTDTVPASYRAGLLAEREGPILEQAVRALGAPPDVLLVDATGVDHPRRAGLAIHLGAVLGVPTVGVTHRTLHAAEPPAPAPQRGSSSPVRLGDEVVGHVVRTRDDARPVVAHAAWRTGADEARAVVLLASTPASRTPVPLGEARRVAREARAIASGEWG